MCFSSAREGGAVNQSIQSPETDDQFDEGAWLIPTPSARDLLELSDRSLEFLANLNEVLERLLPEQFPPGSNDQPVKGAEVSSPERQMEAEPSEKPTHGTTSPHSDHR